MLLGGLNQSDRNVLRIVQGKSKKMPVKTGQAEPGDIDTTHVPRGHTEQRYQTESSTSFELTT